MKTEANCPGDTVTFQSALDLFETESYEAAYLQFKCLSEAGVSAADFYVGWMLKEGKGTVRDLGMAKIAFGRAAERGNLESLYYLGTIAEIEGRQPDAVKFYNKAIDSDYLPALYSLGRLYIDGVGSPPDLEKGRYYLDLAAKQGHVFAMRKLAGLMLRGRFGFLLIGKGVGLFILSIVRALRLLFTSPRDDRLRTF